MRKKRGKKKQDTYQKPRKEKLVEAFDLPKDIVLNLPKLIFTGSHEVYIENYRGIVEYSDTQIRLNTSERTLKITGVGLGIKNIATEEITISGRINAVEFL